MGTYDTSRRWDLGQLHEQHRQLADQLAADYQAQLSQYDAYWHALQRSGSTGVTDRDRAERDAARHAYYERYAEAFYALHAQIEQQAAAINADYDAKDHAYEDAFTALRDAPARQSSPYDGRALDIPAAPAYRVNTAQMSDAPDPGTADRMDDATQHGSGWDSLLSWFR